MYDKGLSLDQAPPFIAPLMFFITAPLFAVLAGIIIILSEPSLFAHRTSPEFLAVVHLITIGFFSMIMIGSMQQMLPVLAGVQFKNPVLNAKIIYFFTFLGTTLFFLAFYFSMTALINPAVISLLIAIIWFIFIVAKGLIGVKNKNESVKAMIYSIVSLFMAIIFGAGAGLSYGGLVDYSSLFAFFHISWVFFGWIVLLIIGVSFQMIPMFYVASSYPKVFISFGTLVVFGALIFLTVTKFIVSEEYLFLQSGLAVIMMIVIISFAIITINKIIKRKRAVIDTTIYLWYLSMGSLLVGIIAWFYGYCADNDNIMTVAGIVLGIGFVFSLINAMLYKIVPFLVWFHLSNMGHFSIPTMRDILPDKKARVQFYMHIASLLFFVAAPIFELYLYKVAALFFTVSNIMLFMNIYKSAKVYFEIKDKPVPSMNFDMSAFTKK